MAWLGMQMLELVPGHSTVFCIEIAGVAVRVTAVAAGLAIVAPQEICFVFRVIFRLRLITTDSVAQVLFG